MRTSTGSIAVLAALLVAASLPARSAPVPATPGYPVAGPPADTAAADTSIYITDVRIPLRDGVELHGRTWRPVVGRASPHGGDPRTAGPGEVPAAEPRPVVLSLTPYTLDDAHERGRYFAERGYVYLNVDARGRGASGGTFRPLAGEGPDAADVVRWAAEQAWSDGRVVMRGGSYRGMVQWQTLAAGPPQALEAVVPTASVHPGWDYPNPSGIFMSYATRWLAFVQGNASQGSLFGDSDYWEARYRAMHRQGRPFTALDEITGLDGETFERWTAHPWYDDFWRSMNPDSADYRAMDVPVLTITGHFDGDQPGALRYYRRHVRWGPEEAVRDHHLVVGPWSHGGTRDPQKELRGLTFADTAVIDVEALHDAWYRWALEGEEKPPFLEDRVVYYVMGADEWRSAPSLEAVSDTARRWYLTSPGTDARDPFRSGRLTASRPDRADVDRYTYDPRDTADVATWETMEEDLTAGGAAFLDDPKLVYHSPPLERDVEVSGAMELHAWIELDVPGTDLAAWVYEVRPDGETLFLGRSFLRARHREGVDRSEPIAPGEVLRYTFDRFYWFSRELQEGSRLRLVILPLNSPEWDKNYQAEGHPIDQSAADARPGTLRLHTGPEHPSRLVLPVRSDG